MNNKKSRIKQDVGSIYKKYKNGSTPESRISYDEDENLEKLVSNSNRNDTVLVQHIENDTYAAIRIIPNYQSRSQAMRESMKKPKAGISRDFKNCNYQLMSLKMPELRGDNSSKIRPQDIHRNLHWNSQQTTRLRTATSSRKLQSAWNDYIYKLTGKNSKIIE